MITTKEELGREMLKALDPFINAVKEAYEEAFDKLTTLVGVNPYHKQREAEEAHSRRLLTLPPNLRSAVCGGIEISLAEKVFADHGRDLTDHEFDMIRFALKERVAFSTDDLQELAQRLSDDFAPKPIKQIPNGIPWNKKRDFKRPK